MANSAVTRLSALLATERAALLSGDLDTVGKLLEEKEALASELSTAPDRDLKTVAKALAHNGTLLAAARDGVADVLSTLAQQRAARRSLSSYDSAGNPTEISQPKHATERRF